MGHQVKRNRIAFLSLLCLVSTSSAAAEFLQFRHLSTDDGLAHSTVWNLTQDRQGFIWISTEGGLQRFDGSHLTTFAHDPADPTTVSANETFGAFEDRNGSLWLASRNRGLNRYDPALERFERIPLSLSLSPDGIRFRELGSDLWALTDRGLLRLNRQARRFESITVDLGSEDVALPTFQPLTLEALDSGLLLATSDGRLFIFDPTTSATESIDSPFLHGNTAGLSREKNRPTISYRDPLGNLWIGSYNGSLYRSTAPGRGPPLFRLYARPINGDIHSLMSHGDDLWIGSNSEGLARMVGAISGEEPDSAQHVEMRDGDPTGPSSKSVYGLYIDRSGILWSCTRNGLDLTDLDRQQFRTLRRSLDSRWGLASANVSALGETPDGRWWIAGNDWLTVWHPASQAFERFPLSDDDGPITSIKAIFFDRSRKKLWLGAAQGLFQFDQITAQLSPTDLSPTAPKGIRVLIEDPEDRLWMGSLAGLSLLDDSGRERRRFETGQILALSLDHKDRIWIGTTRGLRILDRDLRIRRPAANLSDIQDEVFSLYQDSRNDLWIGLRDGGLIRKRGEDDTKIQRWNVGEGLPSGTIAGVLEDDRSTLWLSTQHGISHFDPEAGVFHNFDIEDGLHNNVFFTGTALRSSTGEMIFGGNRGLTYFDPSNLRFSPHPPAIVLTHLLLNGAPVEIGVPGSPLQHALSGTESLALNHLHRTFEIGFTALHFANPKKVRFLYRLEGFDEHWIETDAEHRSARYTNIDPGRYRFQVKARSPDGVWSEEAATMAILVAPAPWRSPAAYGLYSILVLALVAASLYWSQQRYNRERSINQRLRAAERQKDEFIANTSHELRTPLYGITGLAEGLIDGMRGPIHAEALLDLSMIAASGHRLSRLVEAVLDFSNIRHDGFRLHPRQCRLESILEEVVALTRPAAQQKGLHLTTEVPQDLPPIFADENRLFQVVFNLVENGIKFTDAGFVQVRVQSTTTPTSPKPKQTQGSDETCLPSPRLRIEISDSGVGIATSEVERILQAFEQADGSDIRSHSGTGLGLTIANRLVQLHGSSLAVTSSPGQGSTFAFEIPVYSGQREQTARSEPSRAGTLADQMPPRSHLAAAAQRRLETFNVRPLQESRNRQMGSNSFADLQLSEEAKHARILAVDDEPTNLLILTSYLSIFDFRVTSATHGKEALDVIAKQEFDLVLLDIMMPEVSGYEVCRELRSKFSFWQLPIIFLSAKTKAEDTQKGLALGANDYLPKPIGHHELVTRLRPHLELVFAYRRMAAQVQEKLSQIKVLGGLLPICSCCKKIRDDEGYWEDIEQYIDQHSEAAFTHGVCPDCSRDLLQDPMLKDTPDTP